MTQEDWTTFIFISFILWALGATLAGFFKWDELTRRENQAGMALPRKELTPPMAREILKHYAGASAITILWPISFVVMVLAAVGWVIWQGLKVAYIATKRS